MIFSRVVQFISFKFKFKGYAFLILSLVVHIMGLSEGSSGARNSISSSTNNFGGRGGMSLRSDDRYNQLVDWLRSSQYNIQDVLGDGNCLFSALALQLFNDTTQHSKIRDVITTYMADNKNKFRLYMEDNIV